MINPDHLFEAHGYLIFDDGNTVEMERSTEIVLHLSGT
jgi:hypothetical protein